MEQFELQKPISQLFGALKSHFLECEPFSCRSFGTTEQNPLFQTNNFCVVITLELYLKKADNFGRETPSPTKPEKALVIWQGTHAKLLLVLDQQSGNIPETNAKFYSNFKNRNVIVSPLHSLSRAINFNFPLQPHQGNFITQHEELGFSWLTQMEDDYATNYHY